MTAAVAAAGRAQERDPLPVPDLPGLRTLKADFHLHTVFSDGDVWPTVHVWEAWRDGLDAIALTDHVEYHPKADDVSMDLNRPHEVARSLAERLGVILVKGVEITRPAPGTAATIPVGSGHFNALFVTEAGALDVPDLLDALRRARGQGAFVFWNHPGFMNTLEPHWFPHVEAAHREGLVQGMELVNGKDFYATAYPWIDEKRLAIVCNSDAHQPTPPRAVGGARPITLVFSRRADAEGVREALAARRTAAWLGEDVWGAEEHLRGLWEGAAALEAEPLAVRPGGRLTLRVRNSSAIPFRLRPRPASGWLSLEGAFVRAQGTSLVHLPVKPEAPPGAHRLELEVELANLHTGPGRNLVVRVPLAMTLSTADDRSLALARE